jgi:dTDP-4-dehydrorhamnose 3,5-epimerase
VRFIAADLPGVVVIEPDVHRDERGFFLESYHADKYREGGVDVVFVQDNHSRSTQGILRGLHMQLRNPQGKLVRVIEGEVFDVAVDVRVGSPTFAKWVGVTLSSENHRQVYVPEGFAHGFVVTSEAAEFEYKCTNFYDPGSDISIAWDDPQIGIEWPIDAPVLSAKDKAAPKLSEVMDQLPRFEG